MKLIKKKIHYQIWQLKKQNKFIVKYKRVKKMLKMNRMISAQMKTVKKEN